MSQLHHILAAEAAELVAQAQVLTKMQQHQVLVELEYNLQ